MYKDLYKDKTQYKAAIYSRRQLLSLLLTGTAGALATTYWSSVGAETPLKISFPENNNPENPSLDIFIALSQLITFRENLDRDTAKRIYDLIIDEPWGKQYVSRSYAILRSKASEIKFDEGTSWFVSHLLTTWYLGIYYHENKLPQRVTYEHALMFDAVKSFYPVPILTAPGYGTWAKPA